MRHARCWRRHRPGFPCRARRLRHSTPRCPPRRSHSRNRNGSGHQRSPCYLPVLPSRLGARLQPMSSRPWSGLGRWMRSGHWSWLAGLAKARSDCRRRPRQGKVSPSPRSPAHMLHRTCPHARAALRPDTTSLRHRTASSVSSQASNAGVRSPSERALGGVRAAAGLDRKSPSPFGSSGLSPAAAKLDSVLNPDSVKSPLEVSWAPPHAHGALSATVECRWCADTAIAHLRFNWKPHETGWRSSWQDQGVCCSTWASTRRTAAVTRTLARRTCPSRPRSLAAAGLVRLAASPDRVVWMLRDDRCTSSWKRPGEAGGFVSEPCDRCRCRRCGARAMCICMYTSYFTVHVHVLTNDAMACHACRSQSTRASHRRNVQYSRRTRGSSASSARGGPVSQQFYPRSGTSNAYHRRRATGGYSSGTATVGFNAAMGEYPR